MNRDQKKIFVKDLREGFESNTGAFLVKVKGLTVSQLETLRKDLRNNNGKIKVVKDRLAKLAIQGLPIANDLNPLLKDQIALVFSKDDAASAAKVLNDFSKESSLDIVAGLVGAEFFEREKVIRLASIPSREVLLAQICGLLKAPVSKLAYALSLVAEKGGASSSEVKTEEVKEEGVSAEELKSASSQDVGAEEEKAEEVKEEVKSENSENS